jgi:AIR synthase-related protein
MVTEPGSSLEALAASLRNHPNVVEKLRICSAYAKAMPVAGGIDLGDDAAAIPDGEGYLLLAAEGMIEAFVDKDPWFAGYSAVMVNLSDIAAMGGRPTALVDVIWLHADSPKAAEVWEGMRAASEAYGVPIVGGHTTRFPLERTPLLAVAVLGRAKRLITSFGARPGDALIAAVDLRGSYRGENTLFWNASVGSPTTRLREDLNMLPIIAERGLVTSGKDISNGGIPGTLAMLLATSRCGAVLDLDALPMPSGIELGRWLLSFPSYGYLLTAPPEKASEVCALFHEREIAAAQIGQMQTGDELILESKGHRTTLAQIEWPPEL